MQITKQNTDKYSLQNTSQFKPTKVVVKIDVCKPSENKHYFPLIPIN